MQLYFLLDQNQQCITGLFSFIFKLFAFDFYSIMKEVRCYSFGFVLVLEDIIISFLCVSTVAAGFSGFFVAKARWSFYADILMSAIKYLVGLFELGVIGEILIELSKFSYIQSKVNNSQAIDQAENWVVVYVGLCVFFQMILWGFYVYILYQYQLYSRSKLNW